MSFRDQVAADIDAVFLNTDEFAELHTIDGVEVRAVASENVTRKKSGIASRNYDGLHGDYAKVTCKAADLQRVPNQGENIKLDGKRYKVERCVNNMGMLTLTLAAYRMGGVT
ncbi:hypothetical protein [Selenomonas artemidis]|jgi:hypothetical protein|uniref:hypothetical protein n=1 Tax=Selenomonas artemidis TaxID=671224 RepID=UPI002055442F|nr:hypothetical protein [Selenomonas artemidis]DAF35326.1 MAG TPA: ATP-binding sugar transporter [Caudoviricetes sp.]